MSKKANSILLISINFFFVIVAALILINIIPKNLFQKKADSFFPDIERIEATIPAKGFIAKKEIMYMAPAAGKVKRIKMAPELLAKNVEAVQIIMDENKPAISVKANDEGFITYIKDNCEEAYSWDKLQSKTLTVDEILNPPVKQEKVSGDQIVEKGDFLFKIVKDNFLQYYLVLDSIDESKFVVGESLVFSLQYPRTLMADGKIIKKTNLNKEKVLLVFDTPYYIEPVINDRKIEGNFTFGYSTACYIPVSAVQVRKSSKGSIEYFIYLKEQKDNQIKAILTKINVLGMDIVKRNYIVNSIKEDQEVFKDFAATGKKYFPGGK